MSRFDRTEFIISEAFIKAFSVEEVKATWDDMVTLGIARPPYPDFDIVGPTNIFLNVVLEGWGSRLQDEANYRLSRWLTKIKFTNYKFEGYFIETENRDGWKDVTHTLNKNNSDMGSICAANAYQFLIVALATRNVIREEKLHKAARLGIGKAAKRGIYRTVILRTPPASSLEPGGGHHASPRPHLRRGHIRNARVGTGRAQVRQVWIEPTFINASEDFINERTAYELR
jgi:hypothetical protein